MEFDSNQVNPARFQYIMDFKSLPMWKKTLMVQAAMCKKAEEIDGNMRTQYMEECVEQDIRAANYQTDGTDTPNKVVPMKPKPDKLH